MENYNLYLIKNLLALTVIGFIIAPANVNVTKDILTKPIPDVSLNLSTTEPVDLDFDAILERGSIRVITNYNVGSYFLQGGLDRGFEYEFLAMFARQHGLTVEVILLQPGDDPVEVLNRGAGDIIATNFIKTSLRERQVTFSEPYKIVDQHIILPDTSQNFTSLAQLDSIPISVQRNSAQHEILLELKEQGYAFTIDLVSPEFDKEALVVGVAENRYKATIADDHQFNAMKTYVTGVQLGPRISEAVQVGWGIRQNAEKLQKEVDKYVYGNFK
ncbi:MAG: transporter substrate-binding domain-containing protein, partial [Balneolales bacterium]